MVLPLLVFLLWFVLLLSGKTLVTVLLQKGLESSHSVSCYFYSLHSVHNSRACKDCCSD